MLLKAPRFWKHKNWIAMALSPLSLLYLVGHRIKTLLTKSYRSTLPVICVGGVVVGGSGKTPVVHALIKLIRDENLYINPVILTRGYGGKLKGPTLVDPAVHTAADVGDEALLHALHAPTIISADRASGARLAEAMGADVIVMDDGLQNNTLEKTLSFLVLDTRQGFGNRYLLPAGPLREPLQEALDKCACVIQTNGKADPHIDKPVMTTSVKVLSLHDKEREFFAFAGLGNPEKFKMTLEENGFRIATFKSFPDHHPYTTRNMESIKRLAGNMPIITTHKDYVRIPVTSRDGIEVLLIEQVFDFPAKISDYIKSL